MFRTLLLAAMMTLFGVVASNAQYQDSSPPDPAYSSQYDTESAYDDYDEELLGPRDDQRYDNRGYDDRGYNEPDLDVGIFASLGHDGRWQFAANLGWVWSPYTNAGWRPYSNGHWVWTSYGWTWVSYEPFGWATYHYGYWACDNQLGWVWIPGYDWSACRVQWAHYDNYVSWAPLAPPGYYCPRPYTTAGINIWFTIGASHFCDPYPTRYCETPRYDSGYATRVKYKSPDRGYVAKYSGAPVRTASVTFKHKALSRAEMGTTTYHSNPKRVTATTSHGFKPEVRNGTTLKSAGRTENRAMKSRESKSVQRQFQPQEARRTTSTRQAVKPSRQTKSYRDAQESRTIRADRPAKLAFNSARSPREQRVVSQPRQEQRSSKASVQSSRGSSNRKNTVASNQTQRRETTKVKGAGGAHGKGSGKGQ
jgi:hypothetical protein